MLKKIIIGVLFTGLVAVLVWGGVNRTLAKNNEPTERAPLAQNQDHETSSAQTGVGRRDRLSQDQETQESLQGKGYGATGNGNGAVDQPQAEDHQLLQEGQGNPGGAQGKGSGSETPEEGAQGKGNADGETPGRGRGGQGNGNGAGLMGQGGAQEPLDEADIDALHLALDDEYHALATYQAVLAAFGDVEPFNDIAQAEQKHIDALVNQFNKYAIPVPENPWIGNVPVFESVSQACQAGVEAEIANAGLYDQLFQMTDNEALTRVFTNLRRASLENHLPQFEACQ